MAIKVDIHIYAVKSRKENVERLIKKLGEKNVTIHWDESNKPTPYERYYENCKDAAINYTTKKKIIDLVMRLDVSTVTA